MDRGWPRWIATGLGLALHQITMRRKASLFLILALIMEVCPALSMW